MLEIGEEIYYKALTFPFYQEMGVQHELKQHAGCFLPSDDDHEVHDVPHVPEVAAGVENKALSEDLEARLNGEDAEEI